jgi:hypothetical protein
VAIRKTLNPPELAEAGTFPTANNNGTIIKNPRAKTGREEPTDAKHRAGYEHYDTLLPRAFTKSKIFLFTNVMKSGNGAEARCPHPHASPAQELRQPVASWTAAGSEAPRRFSDDRRLPFTS